MFPLSKIGPALGRTLLLFLWCLCFPTCQSDGQSGNDESDYFSRRKVPEYVIEALPTETDTLLQTTQFTFLGHGEIDIGLVKKIAEKSSEWALHISEFTGGETAFQMVYWHLYPSSETKGLMLKNSTPIQFDFQKREIHMVANPVFSGKYVGQASAVLWRQAIGKASSLFLENGMAIRTDPEWQGYGHRFWAKKLILANGFPTLPDLLNEAHCPACSPLIFGAASACFVDFLMEKWGRDVFLEKYTSWKPAPDELNEMEKEWEAFLQKLAASPIADGGHHSPHNSQKNKYLQGFNFAHEGYRVYNGYGSRKAEQALQHLTNLGSNAIAIVPYTFLRNANTPTQIPVVQHTGAENDESVITTAEDAQGLGMTVVLKPQIWMGGGQWPGDIEMKTDEDWGKFFYCYRHWILHFAMLSEIYGWDALCVGTEMVRTTLERAEDWKQLFRDIRQVYGGQLTYAANWGEEFEKTKIWDEVDFIGLNCYYPLSQKDDPSDGELESAFGEVMKKAEAVSRRYGKPVVFTEIGFPSIESPWKKPHEDWGDFTESQAHQRRCYEMVFRCIEDKKWCGGILWWKYPCDLEHQGRRGTGFTPHGKMAEATVEKWFRQKGE